MTDERDDSDAVSPQGAKRSADHLHDSSRKKRGRYTLNACDECKRRKSKCSGEVPCQLCRSISAHCEYSRERSEGVTQKYMNSTIQSLQKQIQELGSIVSTLRSHAAEQEDRPGTKTGHALPKAPVPYRQDGERSEAEDRLDSSRESPREAPTNSSHSLQYFERSLIHPNTGLAGRYPDRVASHGHEPGRPVQTQKAPIKPDPLDTIALSDMLRYLGTYEDDIGTQHPSLIEIEDMLECIRRHLRLDQSGVEGRQVTCASRCYLRSGRNSQLRAVLALMMIHDSLEHRYTAERLMESIEYPSQTGFTADAAITHDELLLLVLEATYHFFTGNERITYRKIGFAARMCLEAGLHRKESLLVDFPGVEDRRRAIKLFWIVYILDSRWSFGSGLPLAFKDSDINQVLDDEDPSTDYLRCMISYCRFASRAWGFISDASSKSEIVSEHDVNEMDSQMIEWRRSMPRDLYIDDPFRPYNPKVDKRGHFRMQIMQYLRANHMRILIHRSYLFSKSAIRAHSGMVRKVIGIAKDTIKVLQTLHATADFYQRQHVVFNHFLDTALAVLLLAVCNDPRNLALLVRHEVSIALELVQTLSTKSPISKRLWNRVKMYKDFDKQIPASSDEDNTNSQGSFSLLQAPEVGANLHINKGPSKAVHGVELNAAAPLATAASMSTDSSPEGFDPEVWKAFDSLIGESGHILDLPSDNDRWRLVPPFGPSAATTASALPDLNMQMAPQIGSIAPWPNSNQNTGNMQYGGVEMMGQDAFGQIDRDLFSLW